MQTERPRLGEGRRPSFLRVATAAMIGALFLLIVFGMNVIVNHASGRPPPAMVYYVSVNDPDCAGHTPCYSNIQQAIDQALDGAEIRVATGVYTDAGTATSGSVVQIDRSVKLRGGWDMSFGAWDPGAFPTTLSAEGKGRVVYIGSESDAIWPTVEGFVIQDGNAVGRANCGHSPAYCGGGIFVHNASPLIAANVISGNVASTDPDAHGLGGGLYVRGYGHVMTLTLRANVIQHNSAYATTGTREGYGGGVYVEYVDHLVMDDNKLAENGGATRGGGIYLEDSRYAMVHGNALIQNVARSGGAIFVYQSDDLVFTSNQVMSNTEGFEWVLSWSAMIEGDRVAMDENLIRGNHSGGLRVSGTDSVIQNSIFARNSAGGLEVLGHGLVVDNVIRENGAGGVHLSVLDSIDSLFQSNQVLSNTGGVGLLIENGCVIVADNMIAGNISNNWGGGVRVEDAHATLTRNTILRNAAESWSGGGVYVTGSSETVLTYNTISTNTAAYGGGVYLNYAAPGSFQHNVISGNEALDGAGVSMRQTLAEDFSNNLISRNHAFEEGGGIYVQGGWVALRSNTVSENEANDGAGIYLWDVHSANIEHNVVSANRATGQGGGFYHERGAGSRLVGNILLGNEAQGGAGLYLCPFSPGMWLEGNWILSNTALGKGGGVLLANNTDYHFVNNVFADNHASSAGEQLAATPYWPTLTARFEHNTFAHSTQGDGAIYVNGKVSFSMTNTIIANHACGIRAPETGAEVYAAYTLFADNGVDYQGAVTSTHEVTGVTAFANPAAGDYHLTLKSDAIDAGIDTDIDYDIDGDLRPYGPSVDIGADEAVRIGVGLGPDHALKAVPDTFLTCIHTLTNTGLLSGTYAIHLDSSQGWAQLPISSPIFLEPGLTTTLVVNVVVPPNSGGLVDVTVITATSVLSPAVFDTAVDSIAAFERVYLPLVIKG